jgi:hypothetical protein
MCLSPIADVAQMRPPLGMQRVRSAFTISPSPFTRARRSPRWVIRRRADDIAREGGGKHAVVDAGARVA